MSRGEEREKNQKSAGTDFENAIVFESVANNITGVMKEYEYLNTHYPSGKRLHQRLCESDGRYYDVITIEFPDGMIQDIYFDITNFFGKGEFW